MYLTKICKWISFEGIDKWNILLFFGKVPFGMLLCCYGISTIYPIFGTYENNAQDFIKIILRILCENPDQAYAKILDGMKWEFYPAFYKNCAYDFLRISPNIHFKILSWNVLECCQVFQKGGHNSIINSPEIW